MPAIDLTADILDSRDIIERIAELDAENEEEPLEEGSDEWNEYASLQSFVGEAEGADDWEYGATFIRESYFEDYAKQLAEDLGEIDEEARWPACHIDWEAAADSLQMDYTSYTLNGETYWAR